MIDLKVSREHIDAIDKQIVELFEKRMIESSENINWKPGSRFMIKSEKTIN